MYKTITQIHSEYDGQWVFLVNCKEDEYGSVASGEVAVHSRDRDAVVREMEKYDHEPSMTYFRYAGKIPAEVSVIL